MSIHVKLNTYKEESGTSKIRVLCITLDAWTHPDLMQDDNYLDEKS